MLKKFEGFRYSGSLEKADAFYGIIKKEYRIDIKEKNRKSSTIKYRRFFYKFMKEVSEESLTPIGGFLGQDHATVLYAIRKLDQIFGRKLSEKREYDTLKASALGMSVPEVLPDEKDKYIKELTERIKSNSSLICNYQSKLTELEESLSKSNYKAAKLLTKNSELRKEITFLNQEMKSIYSAYKKHKGIEI